MLRAKRLLLGGTGRFIPGVLVPIMVGFGILAGKSVDMVLPADHARLLVKAFWMICCSFLRTLVSLVQPCLMGL